MKSAKYSICTLMLILAVSGSTFAKTGTISTTRTGTISTTRTGTISTTVTGVTRTGTISTTRTGTIATTRIDVIAAVDRSSLLDVLFTAFGLLY